MWVESATWSSSKQLHNQVSVQVMQKNSHHKTAYHWPRTDDRVSASQTRWREETFRRRKVAKGTPFYKRSRPMGNWPPSEHDHLRGAACSRWLIEEIRFSFGLDTPKLESTSSKETVWSNLVNYITRRCTFFFIWWPFHVNRLCYSRRQFEFSFAPYSIYLLSNGFSRLLQTDEE